MPTREGMRRMRESALFWRECVHCAHRHCQPAWCPCECHTASCPQPADAGEERKGDG